MAFVNPSTSVSSVAVAASTNCSPSSTTAMAVVAGGNNVVSRMMMSGRASSRATSRGAFVVLEGVDRCGKTTQSSMLLRHLNGPPDDNNPHDEDEEGGSPSSNRANSNSSGAAVAMRFPDRTTPIGRMIDSYLKSTNDMDDRAIHLLFGANRWEAVPHLTRTIATGRHVICDRYAYSGVAFSSSKIDAGDGKEMLGIDWCRSCDVGLPAPDLVLFLDLDEEEAERRGGYGGERYEKRDVQRRVRRRFDELRRLDEEDRDAHNDSGQHRVPWRVIDASRTPEEVHAEIVSVVDETVRRVTSGDGGGEVGGAPLYRLWDDGVYDLRSPTLSPSEDDTGSSKESKSTSPRSVVAGGERDADAVESTEGKDGVDDGSVPTKTDDDGVRV